MLNIKLNNKNFQNTSVSQIYKNSIIDRVFKIPSKTFYFITIYISLALFIGLGFYIAVLNYNLNQATKYIGDYATIVKELEKKASHENSSNKATIDDLQSQLNSLLLTQTVDDKLLTQKLQELIGTHQQIEDQQKKIYLQLKNISSKNLPRDGKAILFKNDHLSNNTLKLGALIENRSDITKLDILKRHENKLRKYKQVQLKNFQILNDKLDKRLIPIEKKLKKLAGKASHQWHNSGGPFVKLSSSSEIVSTIDHEATAIVEKIRAISQLQSHLKSYPVLFPVKRVRITSNFGRRIDPINRKRALHTGIDFAARKGTAVYATAPGKIIFAGWSGGYGRLIKIKHENNIVTQYAHLNRIRIRKGQSVKSSQRIGDVGNSGRSTGPHLHYEIHVKNRVVDPRIYLK